MHVHSNDQRLKQMVEPNGYNRLPFSVYNNAVKREVMIAISRMVLVHGNGRQTKKKYSATADSRSITI